MAKASLCKEAEDIFVSLDTESKQLVSKAIRLLEDDNYRIINRRDLMFKEGGEHTTWGVVANNVFFAFCEDSSKLEIVHLTVLSKFRWKYNA